MYEGFRMKHLTGLVPIIKLFITSEIFDNILKNALRIWLYNPYYI